MSALAQAAPDLLAKDGIFPLTISAGKALFQQCSRNTPTPTNKVWQPSAAQIQEIEKRLPPFIAERRAKHLSAPPEGIGYLRQYFGYSRGGKKYIYANLFPAYAIEDHPSTGALVVICDGGPAYWGVVYDLEKGSFESPKFNDSI